MIQMAEITDMMINCTTEYSSLKHFKRQLMINNQHYQCVIKVVSINHSLKKFSHFFVLFGELIWYIT